METFCDKLGDVEPDTLVVALAYELPKNPKKDDVDAEAG